MGWSAAFDSAIKRSAKVGRTKEQEGSSIETALIGFGSSAIARILVGELERGFTWRLFEFLLKGRRYLQLAYPADPNPNPRNPITIICSPSAT